MGLYKVFVVNAREMFSLWDRRGLIASSTVLLYVIEGYYAKAYVAEKCTKHNIEKSVRYDVEKEVSFNTLGKL